MHGPMDVKCFWKYFLKIQSNVHNDLAFENVWLLRNKPSCLEETREATYISRTDLQLQNNGYPDNK